MKVSKMETLNTEHTYICIHAGAHTNIMHTHAKLLLSTCVQKRSHYHSAPDILPDQQGYGGPNQGCKVPAPVTATLPPSCCAPMAWCSQAHSRAWLSPNITHVRFLHSACSCALSPLSVGTDHCASIRDSPQCICFMGPEVVLIR